MSLNTTPRTWVSSEVVTAAIMNTEVRDAVTGIQAAWTSYTPTLTNVTLGTGGTNVGAYLRVGKEIHVRTVITLGTGGAFTGGVTTTLPVAPLSGGRQALTGFARDDSAAADFIMWGLFAASTTVNLRTLPTTAGNALVAVNATVPFTAANLDAFTLGGTYEAS